MHVVAAAVRPDVPVGVAGQLEQGHGDVLPEVAAPVERVEPVGAGQPRAGVHVPGTPGGAAGPRPGNRTPGQAGPGQVHGAEPDDGGHPAAQASRHLRGPPVDQRGPPVGEPDPVDRRPERRLDPRHAPAGGQQQAVSQGRPGGEVMPAQPGPDRGSGPRAGPNLLWIRRGRRKWRKAAEPGVETSAASRPRPRGSAGRSATVMCSVAERASGPLILAPGGMPGAAPMGLMTAGDGAAWLTAEAVLAPAGPAPPISAAAARLAVYAGRVNRFSIPAPRDRPPMIKGC